MERSSSTHVVIQTTRSTSIQSFCTKPLIRCHHHHVPPNPFALLDTPLLREPTRLPPLALILYSDRTVRYGPQHCHVQKHSQEPDVWCAWCLKHYSSVQVNNNQMPHVCVLMHTHNSVMKCGCYISLLKDYVQVCLVAIKLWSVDTDFLLGATTPAVSCM